jgi:hypothetical protein
MNLCIIDRAQRLKDAKEDALKEIDNLRKSKQDDLAQHESHVREYLFCFL